MLCLLTKYHKQFFTFCALFMVLAVLSQQTRKDSISQVVKLQSQASQAIEDQDFSKAIVKLTEADKLISEGGFDAYKIPIKMGFAQLNYFIHNYDKAQNEISIVLDALKDRDDDELLASAYLLNGLILTKVNEFTEAQENFNKADKIYTLLKDEKSQASVILAYGILELKQKNYKKAINYFNAAIPIFRVEDMKYEEANAELNKATALLKVADADVENSFELAKASMDRAKNIIIGRNFVMLKTQIYKLSAEIAMREERAIQAAHYFDLYTNTNDSLQHVYTQAISQGLDTASSIGDLNQIIGKQQSEIANQQKTLNLNKMTTGLSIALIIILSLLTLSLYKNNNLRAKANNLLQDKNIEMQMAKEKAEKASLAKAQFLSTITHELRTPLYAVTGLTHLLLEEDPKPHQKEHLNSLKFSGEYLLSLINNILDLNKLEANKVEIEKTTFSLKKRINDVLIALKKSADDRKNNLRLEFDESIPDKLVGDPLKLSQILINLVGNSVKFTQNGEVVVRVSLIEQNNQKAKLNFEIEDNGVGISKKKQKSIFETFSQASLQINRKFGGTGLGLSIVKNLLELMGSKIHLESQLGKGSKFWFNIAFEISEEVKEDPNPNNIIYDVDYVALENRNILVVEDNKINQMITKKILEKNKMICQVADNGMDAIKMVQANNFDVILMDIHMPGISGIETTQKIREFDKNLPIIALTAVTIDENLDDFYRAGFNEIIPKPFKTEEFFEKIYRTLEGKKVPF